MATQESLDLAQTLYIAYYGRPADATGQQFWADQIDANNGDASAVINAFGTSEEFTSRFGELDQEALISNLYEQMFGRPAEQDGLDFYTNLLVSGESTLAEIALDIANGAQGDDATALDNKAAAAQRFTDAAGNSYRGDAAANYAADFLSGVDETTDVDALDITSVVVDIPEPEEPSEPEVPSVPGDTFMLTENADRGADFVGTENDDTFVAPIGTVNFANGNTLNSGDVLDGNGGTNTLEAELINDGFFQSGLGAVRPTTENIQNVIINAIETSDGLGNDDSGDFTGSTVTLNAANMYDVVNVWSKDSNANLVIQDITTKTSDGGVRNTEALTFRMDHTSNANSGTSNQSDMTVYFDENYLLAGQQSEFSIQLRIVNNFQLAENDAPLSGFQTVNFAVGDQQVVVDITDATTYQQVADTINAELSAQGISGVHAAPAPERTSIFSDDVPAGAGYEQGQLAGVYNPVNIVSSTEPLSNGPIELESNIENFDGLNTWVDGDSTITDDPVTTNLELFKAGRGDEGGSFFASGKAGGAIEQINVSVLGEIVEGVKDKSSNVESIATAGMQVMNIVTDDSETVDGDAANLTIRDGVTSSPTQLLNANAFLGDLNLGTTSDFQNVNTVTATGGGDVAYNGTYSLAGDYTITTGTGDDVVNVVLSGVSNSGSTVTSADILSLGGNNNITLGSLDGVVNTANVETRAGADIITGGQVSINVSAGAGNDAVYVDNTGAKGAALVSTDNHLEQTDGSGNASYSFLFGRTVTVTVNGDQGINNAVAQAFNSGFEGQATVTAGSNSRLTTKEDLNNAVVEAVANSPVLSALVTVEITSKNELVFTSKIDGDNISVEIGVGESDWSANDFNALQDEYRAANGNSELTISDSYGDVTTNGQPLLGGEDSTVVNNNTVTLGAGNDTVVLSTQAEASDTIVIDQAFGTSHVVNFTVGQDTLDFSAFLTSQRSPSASEDSRQVIDIVSQTDNQLQANEINTKMFAGNDDVETFADLNASNLLDVFDYSTRLYTNTDNNVQLVDGEGSAIVMVQNDDNAGEYKVFNITFNGTDEDFELSASNIQELGTIDFGADLNDSVAGEDPVDPTEPTEPVTTAVEILEAADFDAAVERGDNDGVVFQLGEVRDGPVFIDNFSAGDVLATPENIELSAETVSIEQRTDSSIRVNVTDDIDNLFGDYWLVTLTGVDEALATEVGALEGDLNAQIDAIAEVYGAEWLI